MPHTPTQPTTPCYGQTDLYYSHNPADQQQAKNICSSCNHQTQCATIAHTTDRLWQPHGIWAGQTPQQRTNTTTQEPTLW